MNTYYIVIDEKERIYNVFDEMNLEYIPKQYKVVSIINGDENLTEALKIIETLRPDFSRYDFNDYKLPGF